MNILKTLKTKIKKPTGIQLFALAVLFAYVFAVITLQCAFISKQLISAKITILIALALGFVVATTLCLILNNCANSFASILKRSDKSTTPGMWFVASFVISMAILGAYLVIRFPGKFSPDSLDQIQQAQSGGGYSDWHPALHTILFFTLPIKIFGNTNFIVLLQCVYFSLAFAYMIFTLAKNGAPVAFRVAAIVFVLCNPNTVGIMMYPWKDCAMAIFAMLLMSFYVNIVLLKEQWLGKTPWKIVAVAIVCVVCTIMRHNAILFTGPLAFVLCAFYLRGWKNKLIFIISCVLLFGGIKYGLYSVLNVQKPGGRVSETTGMCMAIMGNAVTTHPERLNDDVRDFLYEVAPAETWETYYSAGDYNSVKWNGANSDVVEKAGLGKILQYTLKTVKACPYASMEAFCKLTGMVWQIDSFGTSHSMLNTDGYLFSGITRYIFDYIGIWQIILLLFATAKSIVSKKIRPFLHILPIFAYNFGTALLLTGYDWRFFYYSVVVFAPTLFVVLREPHGCECAGKV